MFGYIILRDIPKETAQFDFALYPIEGGFRGFADVKPGLHYVTVKDGDTMVDGFWCVVEANNAIVKRYDYTSKEFVDCDPEEEARYKQMALSGAMNRTLISVIKKGSMWTKFWHELTMFIVPGKFPPELHEETPMTPPTTLTSDELEDWYTTKFKSRFVQAFYDTHKKNIGSFLEELQYAYVRYTLFNDKKAFERWIHLLQAMYNAGERTIAENPDLFSKVLWIIQKQFNTQKLEVLTPSSRITSGLPHLLEDMEDSGVELLQEKATEFRDYAKERGLKLE